MLLVRLVVLVVVLGWLGYGAYVSWRATTFMNAVETVAEFASVVEEAAEPYGNDIAAAAAREGVPTALAVGVIVALSGGNSGYAGPLGEIGLMGIRLPDARAVGFRGDAEALRYPEDNINYGMKFLAAAQRAGDGTVCGTVRKYMLGLVSNRETERMRAACAIVEAQVADWDVGALRRNPPPVDVDI